MTMRLRYSGYYSPKSAFLPIHIIQKDTSSLLNKKLTHTRHCCGRRSRLELRMLLEFGRPTLYFWPRACRQMDSLTNYRHVIKRISPLPKCNATRQRKIEGAEGLTAKTARENENDRQSR